MFHPVKIRIRQRGVPVTVTGTPPDTTNAVSTLAGWLDGPCDGVTRWGLNRVWSAGGGLLTAAFTGTQGPNEAFLSVGDSSGGVFIQDDSGTWKLAGINYGIDGPWKTTANGSQFYGAVFNEDGLYVWDTLIPQDGIQRSAHFYASRVSSELGWLEGITGYVPPAPASAQVPVSAPQPSLQCAGGNLVISYSTSLVGYALQSSSLPGNGAVWQNVTNAAAVGGTNWNITVPMTGASAFFRLQATN